MVPGTQILGQRQHRMLTEPHVLFLADTQEDCISQAPPQLGGVVWLTSCQWNVGVIDESHFQDWPVENSMILQSLSHSSHLMARYRGSRGRFWNPRGQWSHSMEDAWIPE